MSSEAISLALSPSLKSADCAAFLHCLYDITHGNANRFVYVEQVTKILELGETDAEFIIEVLVAQELVRLRLHCVLSITQAGVDEVGATLHQPEPQPVVEEQPAVATPLHPAAKASLAHSLLGATATADLPELPPESTQPALAKQEREDLELKLICEAIGLDPNEFDSILSPPSSIPDRPNGHHAAAPLSLPQESGSVARTLTSLMLQLSKFGLAQDDLAEAEAEIATATAQLLSPRPKQPIIAASLTTLLAILDATPAATSIDLHVSLTEIRLFLTQLQV